MKHGVIFIAIWLLVICLAWLHYVSIGSPSRPWSFIHGGASSLLAAVIAALVAGLYTK